MNIKKSYQYGYKFFWIRLFVAIFLGAAICACEQIVDFDVEDVEQNIVIDASITNTQNNNYVKLSYTESAFKNDPGRNVSGANVMLSDNSGTWESLSETQPGVFPISKISGVYGRSYTLKVEYEGNVYSGSSTMMEPLKFDDIKFDKTANTFFGIVISYYYNIKFLITNDSREDEYFLIRLSNSNSGSIYSTTVYKLNYTGGDQVEIRNTRYDFEKNTQLRIDLIAVDKNAYEYFSQLNTLSGNGDIDVSEYLEMNSFNPKTNLSGGALGYFGAYSYKTYNIIVQ